MDDEGAENPPRFDSIQRAEAASAVAGLAALKFEICREADESITLSAEIKVTEISFYGRVNVQMIFGANFELLIISPVIIIKSPREMVAVRSAVKDVITRFVLSRRKRIGFPFSERENFRGSLSPFISTTDKGTKIVLRARGPKSSWKGFFLYRKEIENLRRDRRS